MPGAVRKGIVMAGKLQIRARGRTRRKAGEMNKLEREYSEVLEAMRLSGKVHSWKYERVALRLAKGCTYNPDFHVVLSDGMVEFHEVKGFWEDDALVKIKVAADEFPEYAFRAFHKKSGQWVEREFEPR